MQEVNGLNDKVKAKSFRSAKKNLKGTVKKERINIPGGGGGAAVVFGSKIGKN